MPRLTMEAVREYLSSVVGRPVQILGIQPLAGAPGAEDLKAFGYGVPVRVDYRVGETCESAVLESMSANAFGHEHMPDRAQALLWEHSAFNRLPRHARALDVGGFRADGSLYSLASLQEPFLLMEFVSGRGYFEDLFRLRDTRELTALDVARSDALCDYLVEIHRVKDDTKSLWDRRLRELLGHGECIFGLTDSYPPDHPIATRERLERIEHACLSWRWRLKDRVHRLRQVHGDFHPWNLLFRAGADFSVLDRSRGEWGEAADDVTCLTINYLFFSLQRSGELEGNFDFLFRRFWDRYLSATGDREMLEVAAPFFAFRGLVIASPVWYPKLDEGVRERVFRFVERVLDAPRFDPARAREYCGE